MRHTAAMAAALLVASWVYAAERPSGEQSYLAHCAKCHQRDGEGIVGQYPPLTNSALWADRGATIRTVLSGRDRPERSRQVMPTHGYLGNEIIAATLSYAATRWGSGGAPFTTEEVAGERLRLLRSHPAHASEDPSGSPLRDAPIPGYVTSDGPALTTDAFARASALYYERCTGCHGVLREGIAGTPLTAELMRQRGTEYLKAVIHYGVSAGMPGWGTTDQLSAADIELLARFLQHPPPAPADMDEGDIKAGWKLHVPPGKRPREPQHDRDLDDLFAVLLHDVASVAFIHGPSRRIIATVPTGRAPHRARLSASGRYLYVICRDGTLTLIDLYSALPQRVAQTRVGLEARAVGVSRFAGYEDRYVLAGSYWPPHLVLLDGRTLEPIKLVSTRSRTRVNKRFHPEPRVTDVHGSYAHPEFIAHIKETGHTYLVPYRESDTLVITDLDTTPELRAGSFALDRRHYLTPTDHNAIVVVDSVARRVAATIPSRIFAGGIGASFDDAQLGQVWMTGSLTSSELAVIGTDPKHRPDAAWRQVRTIQGAGIGAMFVAAHPNSPHVFVDNPLSPVAEVSQSLAVLTKGRLDQGFQPLRIAELSGLQVGPRRVLQPTFDARGAELWTLVWNPQDLAAAIVVVDAQSLAPLATISAPTLVSPTRLYNLGRLQTTGQATPQPAQASTPATGAALFLAKCANCHGTYGEGDGIVTPDLRVVLTDLRYIAAENGGVFPRQTIREIIDGRARRMAHGPSGMPVWGAVFAADDGYGEAGKQRAAAKVDALVDFLEAIQLSN